MAYQVTVTVRRKLTTYQRQEVTATFTEAQVREALGLGPDDDIPEDALSDFALETAEDAATASGWSDEDDYLEPLDPSDDLEIEELEQDEIPLDTPSLDTSFHDHEMDV